MKIENYKKLRKATFLYIVYVNNAISLRKKKEYDKSNVWKMLATNLLDKKRKLIDNFLK